MADAFGLLLDAEGGPGLYRCVDDAKRAAAGEIRGAIGEPAWSEHGLYVEWRTPVDACYQAPTVYDRENLEYEDGGYDYQVWEIMLQVERPE